MYIYLDMHVCVVVCRYYSCDSKFMIVMIMIFFIVGITIAIIVVTIVVVMYRLTLDAIYIIS